MWKVCEERGRNARNRDHVMIELLQRRVQELEQQLEWWHDWHWSSWDNSGWRAGEVTLQQEQQQQGEKESGATGHEKANQRLDNPSHPTRVIDYSKWDSIEVSSSEPEHAQDGSEEYAGEDACDRFWGFDDEDEEEENDIAQPNAAEREEVDDCDGGLGEMSQNPSRRKQCIERLQAAGEILDELSAVVGTTLAEAFHRFHLGNGGS